MPCNPMWYVTWSFEKQGNMFTMPAGIYMDVSENSGFSSKSSIFNRVSIINHPFWGTIFGNTSGRALATWEGASIILGYILFGAELTKRNGL